MPLTGLVKRHEYFRQRYARLRAVYINMLGGKCANCGSAKDLQFDHKNAKTKSIDISNYILNSEKKVLKELKKCQLLCPPCHLEKTRLNNENLGGINVYGVSRHGTEWRYKKGCRCEACKENYSTIRRAKYLRTKT
jgi:hypothetical protein